MNPLVSILIPIFNVEEFVNKCLDSIFRQTYQNIEYIFVNDRTEDKSMHLVYVAIKKYNIDDNRITIINHEENQGIAITRNDCLKYAHGDYILFVDSDDWIENNMIELLVNSATKNKSDIVGCGYYEEYKSKSIKYIQKYPSNHIKMMKAITKLEIKGTLWKLLIKRTMIEINNLKFIPDIIIGEDYLFCCKLFYYSKQTNSIPYCLYHYVQYNPKNYSNYSLNNIMSQIRAIKEVQKFYIEKGIYDKLSEELNFRKFNIKSSLLLDKEKFNIKLWRTTFPESNYMWKQKTYSLGNRLIFLLAQSPLCFLIHIIILFK